MAEALDKIIGTATNDDGQAGDEELRERMRAVTYFARAALAKARGESEGSNG